MRQIVSVLIILFILAWPARLQDSIIEMLEQGKDKPQTSAVSEELREKTLAALELSYTNLREIIKIDYEMYPEEFVTTSNSFHDALSHFPSFRNDHPYPIPYLKITRNTQGEITIVEAEEQPQKQDKDDIEKAYSLAENCWKASQRLLEKISTAKLEQVLQNLEFLRTAGQHLSEKYPEAHNAFLEARKRLPDIDITKPSSKMKDKDWFVTFGSETQTVQNEYYEATEYLRKSYDISQEMLAEYYLKEVVSKTQKTRERLREATQSDPDNAMQEFTQQLDEELNYAATVKDDSQRIALERIKKTDRTRRDAEFNLNIQQDLNRIVEFDIFFDEGKYALPDLSEEGKRIVREIAEGLVAFINSYAETYPGQPVTITIKTVGYADLLGFRETTDLIDHLIEDIQDEIPRQQPARRKFLNKRLSLLRAKSINEAIQHLVVFSETVNKKARLNIQPEIEGKGEDIPPEVHAPYPEADQRRRICKISNIVWSP